MRSKLASGTFWSATLLFVLPRCDMCRLAFRENALVPLRSTEDTQFLQFLAFCFDIIHTRENDVSAADRKGQPRALAGVTFKAQHEGATVLTYCLFNACGRYTCPQWPWWLLCPALCQGNMYFVICMSQDFPAFPEWNSNALA